MRNEAPRSSSSPPPPVLPGLTAHAPTSQGLFNPLNRMVEDELLPVLRANNIQFIAYNPLAAGLLSGKHRNTDGVLEGRFKSTASCLDGGNAALAPRPRTWIHHPPFLPPQIIQITCLVS